MQISSSLPLVYELGEVHYIGLIPTVKKACMSLCKQIWKKCYRRWLQQLVFVNRRAHNYQHPCGPGVGNFGLEVDMNKGDDRVETVEWELHENWWLGLVEYIQRLIKPLSARLLSPTHWMLAKLGWRLIKITPLSFDRFSRQNTSLVVLVPWSQPFFSKTSVLWMRGGFERVKMEDMWQKIWRTGDGGCSDKWLSQLKTYKLAQFQIWEWTTWLWISLTVEVAGEMIEVIRQQSI